MKTLFALAMIMAALACSKTSDDQAQHAIVQPSCGPGVITEQSVGYVTIGRSVDSVKKQCRVIRDTSELDAEAMPSRILTVAFGPDSVRAEIDSGLVWRIELTTPGIRTADSLGVGTPLKRLLALRNPKGAFGEGLFLLSPEHCGLSFQLSDDGGDAPAQDWDRAMLARLPTSTFVKRVLIVGCHANAS
jgi:hypothetical protein